VDHARMATKSDGPCREIRRRATLLIALLTLPLLFAGVPEGRDRGAGPLSESADKDLVAAMVSDINPHLPARDLERIAAAIVRYSAQYGVDSELVTAVLKVESMGRPWAYSPKGAVGLMQVMPHMMHPMGLAGNAATIESNIEAGCYILAHNIRRLGEDQGISAYFWGSRIRGFAYLEKVREARAELRRLRPS